MDSGSLYITAQTRLIKNIKEDANLSMGPRLEILGELYTMAKKSSGKSEPVKIAELKQSVALSLAEIKEHLEAMVKVGLVEKTGDSYRITDQGFSFYGDTFELSGD